MNELVEKFARESGAWNQVYNTKDFMIDRTFDVEKFAELIAKECADICMEMAAKCAGLPGDGALAKDCANWIKKDFGVEE
jgi:hypothetical protein